MTTTPRTARDEILAAAEKHGRATTEFRISGTALITKGSRQVSLMFSKRGELTAADIDSEYVAKDKLATVLAELSR
jgi:hypothetical protein